MARHPRFYPSDARWVAIDLCSDKRPPEVNIEIADDGNYKLYTNAEGTRFMAGCRDFTREEALAHWWGKYNKLRNVCKSGMQYDESNRAHLFISAIKNYKGEKMNKQQAQEQLKEVEKELQRLKAIIEAPERGRFKPEDGGFIYIVLVNGNIVSEKFDSTDEHYKNILALGNCYRTYEEAERARDKQLALTKLQDLADELNDGWVADWGNDEETKYAIYYDHEDKHADVSSHYTCVYGQNSYFESKKAAKKAIKRLTQEEINLIFDLNN